MTWRKMDNEDLSNMFGDFDESKIEMEMAYEAMAGMFKGLRKAGLSTWEAALIVAASIQAGPNQKAEDDEN